MEGKKVSESALVFTHTPMPDEINYEGAMHGGHLLKLIDNVGGLVARRHSQRRVVTASVERMDFLTPVLPGEIIFLKAAINMVGTSSMEIGVRIEVENIASRETRHAGTCYLTFVALDGDGKATPVPPLILVTEEERRRHAKAQERRRYRRMMRSAPAALCFSAIPAPYAICGCPRAASLSLLAPLLDGAGEPGRLLAAIGSSPAGFCRPSPQGECPDPQTAGADTLSPADTLSLVVREDSLHLLPPESEISRGWRCLAFYGPGSILSQTGILANISSLLANANISVFLLSTFDGNFLLVRENMLENTVDVLAERGYQVTV